MSKNINATFITILNGNSIIVILVREDKKVYFNFGSEEWFDFFELKNLKDKIKKKKVINFLNSKKFKKNYKETEDVINNNDYEDIIQKFVKDFKRDRGNRIVLNRSILEVEDA